jgi:hypothetical protein
MILQGMNCGVLLGEGRLEEAEAETKNAIV